MPIQAGDKFAAIVFTECRHLALPAPVQLTPELSLETGPVVTLDDFWTRYLGTNRAQSLDGRSLVFLAKRASATPLVLDQASADLRRSAHCLVYACLLNGIPDYTPEALLLVGGVRDNGVAEIQEVQTLHTFFRHGGTAPRVTVDAQYAQVGAGRVGGVAAVFAGNDTMRFRRGFNAWLRGVWEKGASRRLHQYVRSLDGIVKLGPRQGHNIFAARCESFVTSANPALVLEELYRLRSTEEHLNDWEAYLTPIAGAQSEARYMARAWQAERLSSAVYARMFEDAQLLNSFVDDTPPMSSGDNSAPQSWRRGTCELTLTQLHATPATLGLNSARIPRTAACASTTHKTPQRVTECALLRNSSQKVERAVAPARSLRYALR